jgi:receptor expression-enhancing protein 5/6
MILNAPLAFVLSLSAGVLYPAYHSFKALRTKASDDCQWWLTYWVLYAIFTTLESVPDSLLASWFPLYLEAKLAFLCWLVSPYTKVCGTVSQSCACGGKVWRGVRSAALSAQSGTPP